MENANLNCYNTFLNKSMKKVSFKLLKILTFIGVVLISCVQDTDTKTKVEEYNIVEEIPCFKYACIDKKNKKTYRWVNGVEIWVVKDANYEFLKHVERVVKMFDAVIGIKLIFKGRHPKYTFDSLFSGIENCTIKDKNGNMPDYDAIKEDKLLREKFEGIIFAPVPDECMDSASGYASYPGSYIIPNSKKAFSFIAISEKAINDYRYFYVFAHELAHALGLAHASSKQLITGSTITNPLEPDQLSPDDIMVLWYLYGSSSKKDKLYPLEVFPFEGNFSFLFSYPDGTFIDTKYWQGICAVGGMYPYTAYVKKGECKLEKTGWVNCWGVVGVKDGDICKISVIDSVDNIREYNLKILAGGIPRS